MCFESAQAAKIQRDDSVGSIVYVATSSWASMFVISAPRLAFEWFKFADLSSNLKG
jgi:hypothetical protein